MAHDPEIVRDIDLLGAESAALDSAGLYVGIGAWRPEFGRFIVRDFKVTK